MGEEVFLARGVTVENVRGISFGSNVNVNPGVHLDLRGGILIGSNVDIAAGVRILTADHDPDSPTHAYRERAVTIGSRVWLARDSIVLPGATLPDGVVVAAGCVIGGRVEGDSIYVGSPATRLRTRAPNAQEDLGGWNRSR